MIDLHRCFKKHNPGLMGLIRAFMIYCLSDNRSHSQFIMKSDHRNPQRVFINYPLAHAVIELDYRLSQARHDHKDP